MNDIVTSATIRRPFRTGDLVDVMDRTGSVKAVIAISDVRVRGVVTSDGQWWTHGGWFLTDDACYAFPWIQHHR